MSAGKLASAKGTPCYIVIIVYYCGGHSKRKTLMMSTYNYLTMANQACPPAEGGGHGRIGPPPGSASVGKPLASVRLLRVLQRIYGLPITRIEAIRLKRSVTKTADDINITHSGYKLTYLLRLSSSCPDGTLGDEISPPVSIVGSSPCTMPSQVHCVKVFLK